VSLPYSAKRVNFVKQKILTKNRKLKHNEFSFFFKILFIDIKKKQQTVAA
jgi:hypothetical protein